MRLTDDLNRTAVYKLAKGNNSLDKYRFYKALLLFSELNHSVERFDLIKTYFEGVVRQKQDNEGNLLRNDESFLIDCNETMTADAKIELLICNRDIIMMKYLALKTIETELNQRV